MTSTSSCPEKHALLEYGRCLSLQVDSELLSFNRLATAMTKEEDTEPEDADILQRCQPPPNLQNPSEHLPHIDWMKMWTLLMGHDLDSMAALFLAGCQHPSRIEATKEAFKCLLKSGLLLI